MSLTRLSRTNLEILLRKCRFGCAILLLLSAAIAATAQDVVLQLDAAGTTVKFALDAALHTVHGTFQLKTGKLQYDSTSGKVLGEIVVDAKSGESGNGMRDRKMHKEVLESERYPEIAFHPDHVEGAVAAQGKSSLKVHGVFSVHGTDHEITVPAEVDMKSSHWTATAHFTIPYAKWGIKNPSTFFLHVGDAVEIEVVAAGNLTKETATVSTSGQ
jgi:polyisoprenoid-binding protein YceI